MGYTIMTDFISPKIHANNHYDRYQYTTMLIVIIEVSFMHHMSVLSPELSRYYSQNGKFHPAHR